MSLNVLMFCPNKDDATSYYRGWGPFTHLRKFSQKKTDISLIPGTGINLTWPYLQGCDVVFMQRPYNSNHLTLARMCRENNIPLWVDYDDDLFNVPSDNPAAELYGQEDVQKTIATIAAMADVLTVSTAQLARNLEKLNPGKVKVIRNAVNTRICDPRYHPTKHGEHESHAPVRTSVLWRGSSTHVRDVMAFSDAIETVIEERPQWTFPFVGWNPWFLSDKSPRQAIYVKPMDPIEYQTFIAKIRPAAFQVPLHDNPFNRCKSNIALLEALWSGCVAVCPNWEEWQIPGALRYENRNDYLARLRQVTSDRLAFSQEAKQGWEYVMDNLTLDVVNRQREDILEELANVLL